MNKRCYRKQLVTLILCLMGYTGAVFAESAPIEHAPVAMVTRLVVLFGELEQNIQIAAAQGDQSRLESFLTDDFDMWIGPNPGEPIPRADWVKESIKHPESIKSRHIEQLVAKDFGEFSVVSFKWSGLTDLFVVDIWKAINGTWKLATRYAGPAGTLDLGIPGSDVHKPIFEKKF